MLFRDGPAPSGGEQSRVGEMCRERRVVEGGSRRERRLLLTGSHQQQREARDGAMEAGAIPLGADPQEYRPSDAELVAAEAGDRLAAALSGADDATKAAVSTALGGDLSYKRFDYRVVDVMGSGRYFYASSPKSASLPL